MFLRGLLNITGGEGARDRLDSELFSRHFLYVVRLWHMGITTGVDVAARPGLVGALGSFAVDAGRFGAQQARARAV